MNLNDETLAEFSADAGGVTEPGEGKPAVDNQVAIIDASLSTSTDSDDELNLLQLKDFDTWVKTTQGEQEQLDRIEDVAKDILVAESISRADIERIFSELDNVDFSTQFTDTVSAVVGFTSALTQTNLTETKEFFQADIRQRKAKLAERYQQFLVEKLSTVKSTVASVLKVAEETASRLTVISMLARAASVKAQASNNYLCYVAERNGEEGSDNYRVNKTLKDLRNIPFACWELGEIAEMLIGIPSAVISDFNRAYRDAKPFLDGYSRFKCSISKFQESNRVHQVNLREFFKEGYGCDRITYLTLLGLFSSPVLVESINAMALELDLTAGSLNDASSELGDQLNTLLYNLYVAGMFLNAVDSLQVPASLTITAFNDVL